MKKEFKNIKLARKAYHTSSFEMRMHCFVHAFNKLNNFSMATTPVGMHEDNFRSEESLENKILFTIPLPNGGSVGREGSIVGNRFVYAVLDW